MNQRESELVQSNVERIFLNCLFQNEENITSENTIIVEGIRADYGFNKGRIEANREAIGLLLGQLPGELNILPSCILVPSPKDVGLGMS